MCHAAAVLSDDSLDPDILPAFLETCLLGKQVFAFRVCDSTNTIARRLLQARDGRALQGALVIADFQRGGRGRHGRKWNAPPGTALLFSIVLCPETARALWKSPLERAIEKKRHRPFAFTMAASWAVTKALEMMGISGCQVKWPNDVLAPSGKKMAGALVEVCPQGIVLGIGINVNQKAQDFPQEIARPASSIRLETGKPVSRRETLKATLQQLEAALQLSPYRLAEEWRDASCTLGRHITVKLPEGPITGLAVGLEEDGRLVLQTHDGHHRAIHCGEVEKLQAHAT